MSFIDFIQKLQKQPRYLRIQILWVSVVLIMAIIISLWVVSLKYSFPKITPSQEIKQKPPSLKEVFKASVGVFFEDDSDSKDVKQESLNTFQLKKIQPAELPLSG